MATSCACSFASSTTKTCIFNLLYEIHTCRIDLIFFADEHGARQVGVH